MYIFAGFFKISQLYHRCNDFFENFKIYGFNFSSLNLIFSSILYIYICIYKSFNNIKLHRFGKHC